MKNCDLEWIKTIDKNNEKRNLEGQKYLKNGT